MSVRTSNFHLRRVPASKGTGMVSVLLLPKAIFKRVVSYKFSFVAAQQCTQTSEHATLRTGEWCLFVTLTVRLLPLVCDASSAPEVAANEAMLLFDQQCSIAIDLSFWVL